MPGWLEYVAGFGKMGDRYHALKVTQMDMIHVMKCISTLTCLNDV